MPDLRAILHAVGMGIDAAGVVIIAGAALLSTADALRLIIRRGERQTVYRQFRHRLGRGILLGLEFLVAGDIIDTVAVSPTFSSVGVLAVIVLIRTFLSFTLEMEMTGRWPWQCGREGSNTGAGTGPCESDLME